MFRGGISHGGRKGGCNIDCLVLPFISMSKNLLTGMSAAAKGRKGSTGFDKGRFGLEGGGIRFERGWVRGNFGRLIVPCVSMPNDSSVGI